MAKAKTKTVVERSLELAVDALNQSRGGKPKEGSFTVRQYSEFKGITVRSAERELDSLERLGRLKSSIFYSNSRQRRHYWPV